MAGSLVAMELRTIPVANKNGVSLLLKDDHKDDVEYKSEASSFEKGDYSILITY